MKRTTHPLRDWRETQVPKKTLAALAGEVSVSASHLSEIENGKNDPSLELAVRLSRVTGIDVEKFSSECTQ
jgi:transcriptional regulator with XRE-family HTH domain